MQEPKRESGQDQQSSSNGLLAFRVYIAGSECISFAETAAKAKWVAVRGYREAGYCGPREWPGTVHAMREPIYDNSKAKQNGKGPWVEEYVRDMV